jgi:hypothetical protein
MIIASEACAINNKAPMIEATAGTTTAYLVSPRIFLMVFMIPPAIANLSGRRVLKPAKVWLFFESNPKLRFEPII